MERQGSSWPPIASIFNIVNYVTRRPVENPILSCITTGSAGKLAPDTLLLSRDGLRFGIDDSAALSVARWRTTRRGPLLPRRDRAAPLFYETTRMAKVELKLKDDFLSRVSHELRSPLTSIILYLHHRGRPGRQHLLATAGISPDRPQKR